MLGPSLVASLLLRHGLVAWPLVRVGFALTLAMSRNPPMPSGGIVALGVIALSASVAMLAMRRRGERVLLANLGVSVPRQVLLVSLPPVLLELLLAMVRP